MRPDRFPHILNGPACTCGHARIVHVQERYGYPVTDLHCSECECPRFAPVVPVDKGAEALEVEELQARERRIVHLHMGINWAILAAVVVMIPVVVVNPDWFAWLAGALVAVSTVNVVAATVGGWWRGSIVGADIVLMPALAFATVALCVAIAQDASPLVVGAIVAVFIGLVLGLVLTASNQMNHVQRSLQDFLKELERDEPEK